jgi:hypothetical protein
MAKKKYGSQVNAAEFVAGYLARLGSSVDPLRLEEGLAAAKSRQKADLRDHVASVRSLASTVQKARRATEVAEGVWRMNPSRANLSHAQAAQRSRKAAEDTLLEAVLYDREVYRAALSEAGL